MRLCRRDRKEGSYCFELYPKDFAPSEEVVCSMCGKEFAVGYKLLVTEENFCGKCKVLQDTIWLPEDHPYCLASDKQREERVRKVKMTEGMKAQLVTNEIHAMGSASQSQIEAICLKHGIEPMKWFRKYRHLSPKEVPLGVTKEEYQEATKQLQPKEVTLNKLKALLEAKAKPEQEEEFYLQGAVEEVLQYAEAERTKELLEEIAEQFDVRVEKLEEALRTSKEED